VLIDWFTVAAQIVNFLILVWLLKRFLYRPILDALDSREKRIASELASAAAKQSEAEAELNRLRQKNEEFDRRRGALLATAADEARAERKRLIAAAHADADSLRSRRNEAQQREYQALRDTIERRTCTEVFAIARKVLADLAGATLEAHMSEAFIRRMRSLGPEEKAGLIAAMQARGEKSQYAASGASFSATRGGQGGSAILLVRSAFELPMPQQEAVSVAIRDILQQDAALEFRVDPNLISGIEIIAGGYKVAWSAAGYVASLEEELSRLLDASSIGGTGGEAAPMAAGTFGSGADPGASTGGGAEGSEAARSTNAIGRLRDRHAEREPGAAG
jgi:F-type H+-transporting ATPase subunit b